MIAPSHGVIWRKDPLQIARSTRNGHAEAGQKRRNHLRHMWEGTWRYGEGYRPGDRGRGCPYKMFHVGMSDRNDVISEIFKTKAVVAGCPTFNQGVLPTMAPILKTSGA